MCIICIDFSKGKLTQKEAYRNLFEVAETLDEEHIEELISLLGEDNNETKRERHKELNKATD